MLTFTRKVGQSIRIGDNVKITIREVKGRQVRVMVEAPRSIPVYREEIYEQIAAENERAAQAAKDALKQLD